MSHTTTLRGVPFKDVLAMRQAVTKLKARGVNCELLENAKPRMYYAEQGETCDYVLRLHDGKYDVGFQKQKDGTYAPVFDEWGSHVGGQVGADASVCPVPRDAEGRALHQIGQFAQAYSECAAVNAATAAGHVVEGTHTDAEGNVHITLAVQ